MRDQTYLVKVEEICDEMTLKLLDFGTVVVASELINLYGVRTAENNKDKLLQIQGVISVEKSRVGRFDI